MGKTKLKGLWVFLSIICLLASIYLFLLAMMYELGGMLPQQEQANSYFIYSIVLFTLAGVFFILRGIGMKPKTQATDDSQKENKVSTNTKIKNNRLKRLQKLYIYGGIFLFFFATVAGIGELISEGIAGILFLLSIIIFIGGLVITSRSISKELNRDD